MATRRFRRLLICFIFLFTTITLGPLLLLFLYSSSLPSA
jgi:hypothetical protein